MEGKWLWYLSGAFDTAGTITVSIKQSSGYSVGYEFRPSVIFSRRKSRETIFGMIDEYCEEHAVQYRMDELNGGDSLRMVIDTPEGVKRFLEPISGGFIQQQEAAELMLTEILPKLEEDKHRSEDGFYELMGPVDRLRELSPSRGEEKYTQEYFGREWDLP